MHMHLHRRQPPVKLTREERAEAVRALRQWFKEERGEDVGDLAAGGLLDVVEAEVAHLYYNKGVQDATATVLKWVPTLEEDLATLERRPARRQ